MNELNNNIMGHLAVLRHAILLARRLAREPAKNDHIHDLMDAIHNTPTYIANPSMSEDEYLELYYKPYDEKWGKTYGSLIKIYRDRVKELKK